MQRARDRPFSDAPLRLAAFSRSNAVVASVASLLAWQLGATWPLALGALPSFAFLTLAWPAPPLRGFGAANFVTALRVVLVLGMAVAPRDISPPALGAVALVVLALDALDGWLARRLGSESEFGAVFDMETDALFVLVLGFVAFTRGLAGPFVLLGGLLRPLYVLCVWLRPVTGGEQRRSWFGRVAFLGVVLGLVALAFSQGSVGMGAALVGTSLVFISFARGFADWASSPRAVRPRR